MTEQAQSIPKQRKVITIRPNGRIEFIHDDGLNKLLQQGPATLRRVSHVEPGAVLAALHPDNLRYAQLQPLEWYADLDPVNGPLLGPFVTRQRAIAEEVNWLNIHLLG